MIKNFDEVSKQLRELAEVINAFKSEAVQLRLINLIFEAAKDDLNEGNPEVKAILPVRETKTRRKKRGTGAATPAADGTNAKSKTSGRPGGTAMLARLFDEGFFKTPKTINQLVEHCEHNLALKYSQSDFSGALGRYVRDGKLKRAKNADKQYEYSQG